MMTRCLPESCSVSFFFFSLFLGGPFLFLFHFSIECCGMALWVMAYQKCTGVVNESIDIHNKIFQTPLSFDSSWMLS